MITGQVGVLTKHPGWYGRLVQLFTGSSAYHTITAISETECVSAETPRVRIRPIDYFTGNGIHWTNVALSAVERDEAARFVRHQVGKPYAYLDIVFIIITTITRWHTPNWITDRLMDDRQWFCSELADAGMEAAGHNLFPGRPACGVTPADFLNDIHEGSEATPRLVSGTPEPASTPSD